MIGTFTRHKLTQIQLDQLPGPVELDLTELASVNLTSLEEAERLWQDLKKRFSDKCKELSISYPDHTVLELYGVFPAPVRHFFQKGSWKDGPASIFTFEAFNVNRAKEGEKPQFEHNGWLLTGFYGGNFVNRA